MDNIDLINIVEISYFLMRTGIVFDSGVSSLIINDYFGGKIMKSNEFYNIILDDTVINYLHTKEDGIEVSREEILKDLKTKEKYEQITNNDLKIKEFDKHKSFVKNLKS